MNKNLYVKETNQKESDIFLTIDDKKASRDIFLCMGQFSA